MLIAKFFMFLEKLEERNVDFQQISRHVFADNPIRGRQTTVRTAWARQKRESTTVHSL